MTTALFTHPACLGHDPGRSHPERPARLAAVLAALEAPEFALPAGIGDVLIGIAAPVLAYTLARGYAGSRGLAIVWNIAGIGDLVVAVATGFMSSPGLYQRLAFDEPNTLISAYPLVMIPLFAVPLFILLHVISLRRFFAGKPIERVPVG